MSLGTMAEAVGQSGQRGRSGQTCRARLLAQRSIQLLSCFATAAALAACGQQPPSWDTLLAGKINGQYPDYRVSVTQPGQLLVERPGMPSQTVDVPPIAQHCTRGPRDCGYAVEQMLLSLRDP